VIPVTARAEDSWNKLAEALRTTRAACDGDVRFIADYDELTDESTKALRRICLGCPLYDACLAFAVAARPSGGVWAGRRYGGRAPTTGAATDGGPGAPGVNERRLVGPRHQRTHENPADRRLAFAANREEPGMKNPPTRGAMFAALAPTTPEELAEHDRQRAEVQRQHAAGLRLEQIVAIAQVDRIAAIVHAPTLAVVAAQDPAAAEVIRDACHRRLIELSR